MKVKIIKCHDKNYWYNDKIGNIYEIKTYNDTDFDIVIKNNVLTDFIILKTDRILYKYREEKLNRILRIQQPETYES